MGYLPDAVHRSPTRTASAPGCTLHYAVEPEPLDTAGAVRFAAHRRRHRRALRRGQRRRAHRPRRLRPGRRSTTGTAPRARSPCTGSTTRRRSAWSPPTPTAGCEAFVEKPPPRHEAPTDLINAGTYVLEPSVLDRIADGRQGVDRAGDLPGDGRRRHPLRHARRHLLDRHRHARRRTSGPSSTSSTACGASPVDGVDPRRRSSPSALSSAPWWPSGAVVDDGAVVHESVVMAGARDRGRGPPRAQHRRLRGHHRRGRPARRASSATAIDVAAGAQLFDARIPDSRLIPASPADPAGGRGPGAVPLG